MCVCEICRSKPWIIRGVVGGGGEGNVGVIVDSRTFRLTELQELRSRYLGMYAGAHPRAHSSITLRFSFFLSL